MIIYNSIVCYSILVGLICTVDFIGCRGIFLRFLSNLFYSHVLTHWGRVTHICVSNLTIIWTNDGILLIGPLGTNFSEIISKIHTFSFKKMLLKTLSAKGRPFCLGLNVLSVCAHLFSWISNIIFKLRNQNRNKLSILFVTGIIVFVNRN